MGQDTPPLDAARREWETDPHNPFGITGEDADAYHQRVYGLQAPVEVLVDAGLAEHAWAIWEPLLTGAERVGPL
jgi:exodeoxyribonuclease V gamma subunit